MRYFTADLHLDGTEKVGLWRSRGFPDSTAHREYVIRRINETVSRRDELFIVGDFGDKPGRYRQLIRCRNVWLILGNHDKPLQCEKVFGINKVRSDHLTKALGQPVWLDHYPNAYWPGSHRGTMHLYGHTHQLREATLDALFPERRSQDVGLDNAKVLRGDYVPFDEDYIYSRLMARLGHDPVSFYKHARGELWPDSDW